MNSFKLNKYFKIIVLMTFLICITNTSTAQPWEGKTYAHPSCFLSTGRIANNNATLPGFLMAGYRKTSSTTQPNFYVERTVAGGYYPVSPSTYTFSSDYTVQAQQNCSGTPNANNCVGVSVIEENVAGGGNYALAGAFSDGVFFSMLNSTGAPVAASELFWPFPSGVTGVSQPLIVASTTANEYFITGSYNQSPNGRRMYMLKVSSGGTFFGGMEYNIAGNIGMTPKGILMSPYGSANEVVVVGAGDDITGSANFLNKGFFALFDTTTLNNNSCYVYGQTPGTPLPDDQFHSITIGNNNSSFIVGGYTNLYPNATDGNLWTLDINANGATTNWNTVQTPVPGQNAKGIPGIIERYNTGVTPPVYSYFAVIESYTSNNELMVTKINASGQPFGTNNEFYYEPSTTGTGDVAEGHSISFLNNGTTGIDEGIHVFGTDDNINGGNYFFEEAVFNGEDDCLQTLFGSSSFAQTGPSNSQTVGVNNLSGLSTCNNFNLVQLSPAPSLGRSCGSGNTFPSSGSWNKGALNTSIENDNIASTGFELYPNPANDFLQVKINNPKLNDNFIIELTDCLGRIIYTQNYNTSHSILSFETKIDLNMLNAERGVYLFTLKNNLYEVKQKIVIVRD